jgi:hypothetical protein
MEISQNEFEVLSNDQPNQAASEADVQLCQSFQGNCAFAAR